MDWKEKKARKIERRRRREEFLAKPPVGYENHAKPVTRREFLAHGLIDSMAFVSVPPLLRAVLSVPEARAEASSFLFAPDHVVLLINGTGGPGSVQQQTFVSRQQNGDLASAATLFEHGVASAVTADSPGIIKAHGAWMYNVSSTSTAETNAFYNGYASRVSAETLLKTRCIAAQTVALDDTATGSGTGGILARTFMAQHLNKAYLLGGGLAAVGGNNVTARQYASGLSMTAAPMLVESPMLFQTVRDQNSIRNALDKPFAQLSVDSNAGILNTLAKIAENLSGSRQTIGGVARAKEFQSNASTTSRQTTSINGNFSFLDAAVLDPSTRTMLAAAGDTNQLLSTLAAIFSGAALPIATYWKGNGDHHNLNFNEGYAYADQTAALVAAVMNEASLRGIKATVIGIFDGSYYVGRSDANANVIGNKGDRGEISVYWSMQYAPTPRSIVAPQGAAGVGTLGFASGNLNNGGSIVGNQDAAALALVANLMDSEMGKSYRALFEKLVPRNSFDASNLPRIECIGG